MLRRFPALASLLLGTMSTGARAGDAVPPPAAPTTATAGEVAELTLGEPVAPVAPSKDEAGVGLRSLDANGATLAALRSDERVLVVTEGVERIAQPPENGESFHAPIVAGDGTPIAVTTRGRIALLEAGGTRFLAFSVQRSARPAAIPGSADVVLSSENGSIRRLVRSGVEPRLVTVLEPGDEPVGTLATSTDRAVYFRLDGVLLTIALAGGEPTILSRPARAVRSIRFAGSRSFAAIGGEFAALDEPASKAEAPCAGRSEPPDIDSTAITADGRLVALLAAGVVEVRRLADGTRVRSEALAARRPSALAFGADGRTLWVATASDARPFAISVGPTPTAGTSKREGVPPR